MARGIYEITLKGRFVPALSIEEALLMQDSEFTQLMEENVDVKVIVKEEHTVKLFILAKAMYDTEKFECSEVRAAVCALAKEMGYEDNCDEVADCVITYVERFDEMSSSDLEEWLLG